MNRKDFWVETIGYKELDLPIPKLRAIDPQEIAHALGMMCRFNGHIPFHYSVAEHSLHVSRLAEKLMREKDHPRSPISQEEIRLVSLAALLHDASEYVLADVVAPVKWMWDQDGDRGYRDLERGIMCRVMERFGLGHTMWIHELVIQADQMMLATERAQLKPLQTNKSRSWNLKYEPLLGYDFGLERTAAARAWMRRFNQLYVAPDDLSFLDEGE